MYNLYLYQVFWSSKVIEYDHNVISLLIMECIHCIIVKPLYFLAKLEDHFHWGRNHFRNYMYKITPASHTQNTNHALS